MRCFSRVLLTVAWMCLNLHAEIVTMSDGRVIEGDVVSENESEIVVKVASGKMTLKREEIQSVEKKKSAASTLRDKMDKLTKSADKDSKDEWMTLAESASAKGAREEANRAYNRVIQIDPNNSAARKALGFVKSNGEWVLKSDLKERDKATDGPNAAAANPSNGYSKEGMSKEKIAAAAGLNEVTSIDEKPVNCPNCNGTGIWIVLPCLNCNKSGKPGYKNLGDHFEMDQRCGGTGKTIGMYCDLCNRTGKVLLSHISPMKGGTKQPPNGRLWCPVCHGSGVETYLPCNQCKRSKWPGYMFMGDEVLRCNSCGGAGKKAALDCNFCNKTGLVNAEKTDPKKQFGIGVGPAAK